MEGIKKVFTTELEPYVSELKEVMLKKAIAIAKFKLTVKYGTIWYPMQRISQNRNLQKVFVNNSFKMFILNH